MTAVTADRDPKFSEGDYGWFQVANGSAIYMGTMVMLNASGLAVPASDSSANKFVGVAAESVTGTGASGTSGVVTGIVKVKRTGSFEATFSGTLTQADLGTTVCCVDNATVVPTSSATNKTAVGTIEEVVSSTSCRVALGAYAKMNLINANPSAVAIMTRA